MAREDERGLTGAPRPPVRGPVGVLLSRGYGVVIGRKNTAFDAGRGVVRFDRPVISVGNLSVGGTGKTPMVRHIVRTLLGAGHRPCIAMRGYGGGGESDEARAYQREFPYVPVIAQPNRTDGLIALFSHEHDSEGQHRDCIVLDDGFQHRQIGRELDVVLIDASRSPFHDRLLPAGWLREPVESLKRTGLVVLTHAEAVRPEVVRELDTKIAAVRGQGAEGVTRHTWAGLRVVERGVESHHSAAWLRGKRVLAVCAIGNPGPFLAETERRAGAPLAGSIVLRDHDAFAASAMRRILDQAKELRSDAILVTEKDWSKLRSVRPELWPCPVARAELELAFDRGEQALTNTVLETVRRGVPEHD